MTILRKNILLLTTFLGLCVITLAVVKSGDSRSNHDRKVFQLLSPETTDRIVMISKSDTIELRFNGTWKVNDQHEADRDLIQILFATLQQIEAKRPAPESMLDSIRDKLTHTGIRVNTFVDEEPGLSFVVGGDDARTQAYAMDATAGTPYIVIIPGYRVYPAGIFELEPVEWRDRRIFNFNWRNFAGLRVQFHDDVNLGFEVVQRGGAFGIRELTRTDTSILNTFLDNISLLQVARYVRTSEYDQHHEAIMPGPAMEIEAVDIGGGRHPLEVYDTPGEYCLVRIGREDLAWLPRADYIKIKVSRTNLKSK